MATTYMTSNITNIKAEQTTNKDTTCVPSGFVLKLYQMVNEAPDEIIAVSFPHRPSLGVGGRDLSFLSVEKFLITKF